MLDSTAHIISTPYRPAALYFADADSVEYVRRDEPSVYRRVDELLTLVFSMDNREELIGFQLKGFRAFYLRDGVRGRMGDDFLTLVGILERAVTEIGDAVIQPERRAAYEQAHRIALEDRVTVQDLPKMANG